MLNLRRLTPQDELQFHVALQSWEANSSFTFAPGYRPELSFQIYLDKLTADERGENPKPGTVPDTVLFAFVDNEIVGRLAIRHRLNEFLNQIGGHIGYGVVPRFRRKGYAREMLRQALPIAKSLNLDRVLLTCDDDNVGSIKTIEFNGGVLENKIVVGENRPLKRRYWIDLGPVKPGPMAN